MRKGRKTKVEVGDVFPTKYWGDVVVVCNKLIEKLVVRFVNTGNEKTCRWYSLKKGQIRDVLEIEGKLVCPRGRSAHMLKGEVYKSNYWGDMEVVEYKSSKEVVIEFLDSGNFTTASRDNILKGLVKDVEMSMAITKTKHDAGRKLREDAKERAAALAAEEEELSKAESKLSADSRNHWYKIMRDFKCHFDSKGHLLSCTEGKDRNGFSYTIGVRKSFDTRSWCITYHQSGNLQWVSEAELKSGEFYDRNSEEGVTLEKLRRKTKSAERYEANREHYIAKADEYQRKNVERTRVRNRNRRSRREGAEGKHTLEEVLRLLTAQENKCSCCGVPLTEATRELDHKMPLALGGSNWIENLQWMCQFCNGSKNATHPDEWAIYSSTSDFKHRRLTRLSNENEHWIQIARSTLFFEGLEF